MIGNFEKYQINLKFKHYTDILKILWKLFKNKYCGRFKSDEIFRKK